MSKKKWVKGPMTPEDKAKYNAAGIIMRALGETELEPRKRIRKIVGVCGIEFSMEILKEAMEIEANGGMLTQDESRRRTPGGVFFFLARGKMKSRERAIIFGVKPSPKKQEDSTVEPT